MVVGVVGERINGVTQAPPPGVPPVILFDMLVGKEAPEFDDR